MNSNLKSPQLEKGPVWYVKVGSGQDSIDLHSAHTLPNVYSDFGQSGTTVPTDTDIYAIPHRRSDDVFDDPIDDFDGDDGSDFSDPTDDQIYDEPIEEEGNRKDTEETVYEIPVLGDSTSAGASSGAKQTAWPLSTSPKPKIISRAKGKAGHAYENVKNNLPASPGRPPPATKNNTNLTKEETPKQKVALLPPRKQHVQRTENYLCTEQTTSRPNKTGVGQPSARQPSPRNINPTVTGPAQAVTDPGLTNELAMKFAKRAKALTPPDGKESQLKFTTQRSDKAHTKNEQSDISSVSNDRHTPDGLGLAKKKALVSSYLLQKVDSCQPSDKLATYGENMTKSSTSPVPKLSLTYENNEVRPPPDVKPKLKNTKQGNTRGGVEHDVQIPRQRMQNMAGTINFTDNDSDAVTIDRTNLLEYLHVGDQVLQISGIDVRNSCAAFVTECWKRVNENPVRIRVLRR